MARPKGSGMKDGFRVFITIEKALVKKMEVVEESEDRNRSSFIRKLIKDAVAAYEERHGVIKL